MERVLGCPVHTGAAWNGWALSRETCQLPLRRRDPVLGSLLQRQADEAIARLPPMDGCGSRCAPSAGLARRRRRHAHPDNCSDPCDVSAVTPAPSGCCRCLVPAAARPGTKGRRRALSDGLAAIDRRGRVLAWLFGARRLQQSVQAMASRNATGVPPSADPVRSTTALRASLPRHHRENHPWETRVPVSISP